MTRSFALKAWASLLGIALLTGVIGPAEAQRFSPTFNSARANAGRNEGARTATRTLVRTTAASQRPNARGPLRPPLRRDPRAANPSRELGTLRSAGPGRWESATGLEFLRNVDRTSGVTTIAAHATDDPNRAGPFGVFDGGPQAALALVDEAFNRAQDPNADVHIDTRNDRTTLTVDMGRRVGFVGGATGAQEGNPEARHVRVVLQGRRVITAYPARITRPLRASGNASRTARRAPAGTGTRSAPRATAVAAQIDDTPSDTTPRLGAPVRRLPDGRHESPAWLVYDQRGADGDSTARVLAHTRDNPDAQGEHGVFEGGPAAAFGLIDEAYGRVLSYEREGGRSGESGSGRVRVREETDARGTLRTYTVDMGRRIGFIGGTDGRAAGYPAAGEIEVVVRDRTLVSARPVRANNTNPRTRPNFVRLPRVPMPRALTHLAVDPARPVEQDVIDDHLIVNTGSRSVVSYNADTLQPNVVAWTLEQSDLGDAERGEFGEDEALPEHFPRALVDALRHTPFHRGHMLPRSDRTGNQDEANATFVTGTNMVPQLAENNVGAWNRLEMELRRQVSDEGRQVMVFAGPVFQGPMRRLGGVAVPSHVFKIAVVMDRGQDWNSVNANTRVIAVLMPNTEGSIHIGDTWQQYARPASEVVRLASPAVQRMIDRLPAPVRQAVTDPNRAMDISHLPVVPGEHEADFHARGYGRDARQWSRQSPRGASSN